MQLWINHDEVVILIIEQTRTTDHQTRLGIFLALFPLTGKVYGLVHATGNFLLRNNEKDNPEK